MISEISQGSFSLKAFIIRRMRRLLPALLFMLALIIPICWIIMLTADLKIFMGSVFSTTTLLSNFYFLSQLEYWQPTTDLQPLAHMWSLSIEEQYYLLYPLLVLFVLKKNKSWFFPGLIILTLLGFHLAAIGVTDDPAKNYFHSFSRFWELGAGCIASAFIWRYKLKPNGHIATFGLITIIFCVFFFSEGIRWPSVWTALPILGTMLFLVFSDENTPVGRFLKLRPISYVGLLSYSLYLWHQPILAIIRTVAMHDQFDNYLGLWLIIIFCVALFSFVFVERPLRKNIHGDGYSNRRFIFLTILSSALLSVTGLLYFLKSGEINIALRNTQLILDNRLALNLGISESCYRDEDVCANSQNPDTLLWGDSYAMQIVPALQSQEQSTQFVQRTHSGCPPYLNYAFYNPAMTVKAAIRASKSCIDFNSKTLATLKVSPSIKNVILSSPFEYGGNMLHSSGKIIDQEFQLPTMKKALSNLIKELNDLDLNVVVVSPPPSNGIDLGLCVSKIIRFGYRNDYCNFQLDDQKNGSAMSFLNEIEGQFDLVRLDELICPNQICEVYRDGMIIYRDTGHLSIEGSTILAEKLKVLLK